MSQGLQFAFLVILVIFGSQVVKTWIQARHAKPDVDEELEDTLAKIERLEERIQVLERIITEERYDLKKEIDSL